MAQLADTLDDDLGNLLRAEDRFLLGGEKEQHAIGQLAGQEGVGLAQGFGGGKDGLTDPVGFKRRPAAIVLTHPLRKAGRRQIAHLEESFPSRKEEERARDRSRVRLSGTHV